MLFAFVYSVLRLLLDVVDVRLRVRDPEAELLLLRHQLRVVRRQVKRPQLEVADRTIMAALSRRVSRACRGHLFIHHGRAFMPPPLMAPCCTSSAVRRAGFGTRRYRPARPDPTVRSGSSVQGLGAAAPRCSERTIR